LRSQSRKLFVQAVKSQMPRDSHMSIAGECILMGNI
jgi:hypothetical protein